MTKKFLLSLLASVAVLAGGFGAAYAFGTFKANQEGFSQGGAGQAARLTMRVEAGIADPNSDLVPDGSNCNTSCPGGALTFSITNSSKVPLRVTQIALASSQCGIGQCQEITSNKLVNGSFVALDANGAPIPNAGGNCAQYLIFVPPANFNNWPTIGPHTTLHVNGTDNNQLGAGMIHLSSNTSQGCQGATYAVGLNVTATEATNVPGTAPNP